MVALLLTSIPMMMFNVQPVKSEWTGTVYIRADGNVDPPEAPIVTHDYITYTLIGNITSLGHGIVVEKDNIVIDGAGYTIEGTWKPHYEAVGPMDSGIYLWERSGVMIKNMRIKSFFCGVLVEFSRNCTITETFLVNNVYGVFASASTGFILSRNHMMNNLLGNVIYRASNSIITENYLISNREFEIIRCNNNIISDNYFVDDGLRLLDSYNNVVVNNTVNDKPLVYLENISDVNIEDAGQVILVNCTNIRIENLNLTYTSVGIHLLNTSNTTIANNILNNNYIGILLYHSFGNTIYKNNIENNERCGIELYNSYNNILEQNIFTNDGLYVHGTWNNFVSDNLVNGKPLIYLEGVTDLIIDGENVGQVILVDCIGIRVENITLSYTSVGIELERTEYSIIKGNKLTTGFRGIVLYESCGNTISQNDITVALKYGVGIGLFYQSLNNIISDNSIICTARGGLGVTVGYNSDLNIISANDIRSNIYGMEIFYSNKNTVVENNIADNFYGAYFDHSFENRIYHNNFINNTWQFKVQYSTDIFDDGYPSGGNYWSDYSGVDANGDGIGDTPYVIDENNVDRYPLMGPFGGLTVTGQNVTSYPSSEVCLIFKNVSSEGLTTVNVTNIGPELPSAFKLAWNYYDIKTTANYTGTITIRIVYDDSNMTMEEESSLRLLQWDETSQQWMDITTSLDTENNVIYGETSHLSIFAIVTPLYAPPTTYTLTITTTAGGTTNPVPGTYAYTAGSSVQVTAIPDANYVFDHWELDALNVGSANPYIVLMDNNHTLKAVFTYSPPPPLTASISPLSASILVGQSVTFTSTASGGTQPYTYQWYLNGNPVSGATSPSWTFTPTTSGIYYIYLKVTDNKGNTAQSDTARIAVATVPVGGYSIPIQLPTTAKPATLQIALLTILTAIFITIKMKTKRRH